MQAIEVGLLFDKDYRWVAQQDDNWQAVYFAYIKVRNAAMTNQ